MRLKTSKLSKAVSIALVGGISLSASGAILAQADGSAAASTLATGSRLAREGDAGGISPVLVIDRDDIAATGLTSLADVVFQLTISDGSALRAVTTRSKTSDGSQHASLRGLGSTGTLVLVNGRRWITSGIAGNSLVDLDSIPVSIVERIEILKDGASAIYGSEAMAGVINVITRQDYSVSEANVYLGRTSDGDGEQQSFDATFGMSNDRARGLVSLSHRNQDEILAGARAISSVPVFGGGDLLSGGLYGSGANLFGNLTRCAGALVPTASGFSTCTAVAGGPFTLRPGEDGRQATDFRRFISYTLDGSGSSDRFNFAPFNFLQQPVDRTNLHVQGSLELTESINANLMATVGRRSADQQVEPTGLFMDVRGTSGSRWAFAPTAGNVFNPFGQDLRSASFRTLALGPVQTEFDSDEAAVSLWLDGGFDLAGRDMQWDLGYSHVGSSIDIEGRNHVNLNNLRNAVGNSRRNPVTGALECLDGGGVVRPGCVPFNIFGGPDLGLLAGVITAAEFDAMLDYIRASVSESEDNKSDAFTANLRGSLADLPAGPLGFALGFEHRRTSVERDVDSLASSGASSVALEEPTDGEMDVDEFFAEFNVPLVADRSFAKRLELNLAASHSSYDTEGDRGGFRVSPDLDSDTATRWGLLWQVNDEFLFRAARSKSFRAPDVIDLYAGGVESLSIVADPCNTFNIANPTVNAALCVASGVPGGGVVQTSSLVPTLFGGNAGLESETATTQSAGFRYTPGWAKGLSIGLDWYKIRLEDTQVFQGGQSVLNGCYLNPGAPGAATSAAQRDAYCAAVARAAGGSLASLRAGDYNLGKGRVEGYDLLLGYVLPDAGYGLIEIQWDTTYVKDNTFALDVGVYDGSPQWETRSNLTTRWKKAGWDVTWAMRYYSDMEELCSGANYFEYGITPTDICSVQQPISAGSLGVNEIPSRTYHDVQVGWTTPWQGRIGIGARNVFGKDPPVVRNSFAHSFDAAYDLPGGAFYYLQYSQKF